MNALEITQLSKTYDNGHVALNGIDLTVAQGDFFALLGPNGAGKSTTIGIILSLVRKSAGRVSIFDFDLDTQFSNAKACLGIVPQEVNFSLFESSLEVVVNQAGYYGIDRNTAMLRAEKILRELHLWDRRNEISRNLSGGFKRRLMIARALVHEPKLLILDEPTAGVDVELRRSMWDFLKQLNASGTTIVLTTHYLEEAESLCRNIAIIDNGDIIENRPMKDLLAKLNSETFVLEMVNPVEVVPEDNKYPMLLLDPHTLEVKLEKQQTVNELFDFLSANNFSVKCIRNKSNRLEELFIQLLDGNEQTK